MKARSASWPLVLGSLFISLGSTLVSSGCSNGDTTTGTGGAKSSTTTGSTTDGSGGSGGSGGAGDPYVTAVKSTDWVKLTTGPTVSGGAKQDDIFFLDALHGFVASGPKGAILQTDDGGATWKTVFTKPSAFFRALVFTDAQHGFAGNLGAGLAPSISDPTLVYETSDGGANWAPVTTISGTAAKGICNFTAIDSMNLVGVGRANGPSALIQSSDGGATWTTKDLSSSFSMVIDAHFVSPTDGLVAGMDKAFQHCTIMHTTDAGATFALVFTSKTGGSLCWKLQFPSKLVGYAAVQDSGTGPGTFAKTTDGGATWTELPLPLLTNPKAGYPAIGVGFINEQIGWMASEEAALPVYRTFDGGMTWEVDPALKAPINRFRFIDEHTAYAVGASVWKLEIPKTP